MRGLVFHRCGRGSIPARSHMWVEFVAGSRLATRVFLRFMRFSSLYKNSNSKRIEDPRKNQLRLMCFFFSKYCNLFVHSLSFFQILASTETLRTLILTLWNDFSTSSLITRKRPVPCGSLRGTPLRTPQKTGLLDSGALGGPQQLTNLF